MNATNYKGNALKTQRPAPSTVECPGCSEMTHRTKLFADPRAAHPGFSERLCRQCIDMIEGEANHLGVPVDMVRM